MTDWDWRTVDYWRDKADAARREIIDPDSKKEDETQEEEEDGPIQD